MSEPPDLTRSGTQVEVARHRLQMPHDPQIENGVWAKLHAIETERDRLREFAEYTAELADELILMHAREGRKSPVAETLSDRARAALLGADDA